MEYYGYVGKILIVDLSAGTVETETLDPDMTRNFIGGFGINTRLAYDHIKPGVDALSPDNPIIIGTGPLTGTMAPGSTRIMATTKFPLTGAVGTASGSQSFAPQLKWAGYDHIVIKGRADKPVYLKIRDADVEICDASHLWGKDIFETTDTIKAGFKPCGVIAIGPAGENLVSFALCLVDKCATVGRGGLAAVMGSKNLKAIAVQGNTGVRVKDGKGFMEAVDALFTRAKKFPMHKTYVEYGMVAGWDHAVVQFFPGGNWTVESLTEHYGPEAYKKVKKGRLACPSCFICDKDVLCIPEGEFAGLTTYSASFMNTMLIASIFEIKDTYKGVKLNSVLDKQGICQLTFASMMNYLMQLIENGLISEKDLGAPLSRDFDSALAWVGRVVKREGFGGVLANGWDATLSEMGNKGEQFTYVIKNQDCLWDPRLTGLGTMEFEQIVCPRGPTSATGGSPTYVPGFPLDPFKRHVARMGASEEAVSRIFDHPLKVNVGRLSRYSEEWYSVFSSLGVCNRAMNNRFYAINIFSDLFSAATGFDGGRAELTRCAERSWNVYKALNIREGFSRRHDSIPEGWFTPRQTREGEKKIEDYYGIKTLTRKDVESFVDDYYDERGWDKSTGAPSAAKLEELGLSDIAADLKKNEKI
jgi:aldehyde:ferredoxin oxidoreductase